MDGRFVSGILRYDQDVGQPILAAAAFQAALCTVTAVSALQQQDPFRWSSAEPPRKAAAAMIGCPAPHRRHSQIPKVFKHSPPPGCLSVLGKDPGSRQ